jgi:hypothetical protein
MNTRMTPKFRDAQVAVVEEYVRGRRKGVLEQQAGNEEMKKRLRLLEGNLVTVPVPMDGPIRAKDLDEALTSYLLLNGSLERATESHVDFCSKLTENAKMRLDDFEVKTTRAEGLVLEVSTEDDEQTQIHLNQFLNNRDFGDQIETPITDPKTGIVFTEDHRCSPRGLGGLRLPEADIAELRFVQADISYEDTSFSNVKAPIPTDDPAKVFLEKAAFRFSSYQSKDWRKTKSNAALGLVLTLPGSQLINSIRVRMGSAKKTEVEELYFENEYGEWESIEVHIPVEGDSFELLFAPVTTRRLRIVFVQYSPLYVGPQTFSFDNRVMQEEVEHYEFVIKEIWARRIQYKGLGYFLSKSMEVERPLSFSLKEAVLDLTGSHARYFVSDTVTTDTLTDKYLLLTLRGRAGKESEVIIAVPSSATEAEMLPSTNQASRLNFAPLITETSAPVVKNSSGVLVFGTDYEITYNGINWIGAYDSTNPYINGDLTPVATSAQIRLLAPESGELYWIEYKAMPNQYLEKSKRFFLKNGRVQTAKKNNLLEGEVRVLYVLRSLSNDFYLTPVIKNYLLRVREGNNENESSRPRES